MKRRGFIGAGAVAGLAAVGGGCSVFPKVGKRPNVVFVLTDQWRASAVGYAGNPDIQTPNIDRLAAESHDFKNAVSCCPVCSPARASLITGQYPLTHGVFVNDVCLQHRSPSIADCFNAAGYRTGWIGKWHLDGHGRSSYIPPERRQGFQYWKASECTHNYAQSKYYDNNDPEIKEWAGYDVFAQTDDAAQFIRESAGNPFFLFLSWGPPHCPYLTAPEEFRELYSSDELSVRSNVPRTADELVPRTQWEEKAENATDTPSLLLSGYYAHCTAMDQCIGRLRDVIQQSGLEDDTIFVFTSDHGDMLGSHGQWNKQQPYDESVCVPFLLKVPGRRGGEVSQPLNTPDIFPTLCELCGIPAPESVQGKSVASVLKGVSDADSAALIANYHVFGQWGLKRGGKEWRGVRTSRYTYVKDLNGPWLLFDHQADPYQMNNLINRADAKALLAEMELLLQRKLDETGDSFEPGMNYVCHWNYDVDESGTVKYSP